MLFGFIGLERFSLEALLYAELFGFIGLERFSLEALLYAELFGFIWVERLVMIVVYWYSFSNHYTKRAFTQP